MSAIDVLQESIEIFLPLILILIILLCWRALNSYWIEELVPITRDFRKGEVEYFQSSRQTSENYDRFLYLARMTTSERRSDLAIIISKISKEYLAGQKIQVSPSLHLLMINPHNWLNHHYSAIAPLNTSVKRQQKQIQDYFFEEFTQILNELEQHVKLNGMLKIE
jgi:hypothetical protein